MYSFSESGYFVAALRAFLPVAIDFFAFSFYNIEHIIIIGVLRAARSGVPPLHAVCGR